MITYLKTSELLERYPDLRGIYITCGGVAEVGRALQESGRQDEIRVLSFEDYPEILELIRTNVVDATLASNLIHIGEYPVELIMNKLVFGTEPPDQQLFTEPQIMVRESIE